MAKIKRAKVDAKRPLEFTIKKADCANAKRKDPCSCVIAQALLRCVGEVFVGASVGSRVTKIVTDTKVIRYATPQKLAIALQEFDRSGTWNLPPGSFHLNRMFATKPKRSQVGRKKKPSRSTGHQGHAIPTRRIVMPQV